MKISSARKGVVTFLCASCILAATALAKEKSKEEPGKTVDSGSFGVFTGGQRVATETFSIKQDQLGSVISSEFKSAQGEQSAEQSSELQLTPAADLRGYTWKETVPGKAIASVAPDGTFLIERFGDGPETKQNVQNFLLPPSTAILDDYFFVHREVLAWKYLAMACRHDQGPVQCPKNQQTHFGILNPHERSSMSVSIEFTGTDKVTWHGAPCELSRFLLHSESGDWAFWLDDQMKLVRLLSDGGTEVVRD